MKAGPVYRGLNVWVAIWFAPVSAATIMMVDGSVLTDEVVSARPDEIVIVTVACEITVARHLIQVIEEAQSGTEPAPGLARSRDLTESFGETEDRIASDLITGKAGLDTAAFYRALDRSGKESFLAKFWENHNLIILKYYYGFYLGNRYFSVLDAYFERGHLIRDIYASRAEEQDAKLIESAHNILSRAVTANPVDHVSLCACATWPGSVRTGSIWITILGRSLTVIPVITMPVLNWGSFMNPCPISTGP